MLKFRNPHFNYSKYNELMNIKKKEFVNLYKTIRLLLIPFKKLNPELDPKIIDIRRKRTQEVDDSNFLEMEVQIGERLILIQLPLMDEYGKLRIHGANYVPLFQLVDKPSLFRFDKKTFRFNNNVEKVNFDFKNFRLSIGRTIKHRPDIRLLYFFQYGFIETFKKMRINLTCPTLKDKAIRDLTPEDFTISYMYPKEIKDDFRNNIKKSFLNVFKKKFEWLQDINKIPAEKILTQKFWKKELKLRAKLESKNENIIDRILVFLDTIPVIDKFSKVYMVADSILEEAIYFLNQQEKNIDFKDISNKRLRSLEIFLAELIKYIHGMYVNMIMGKKIFKVNKRKDIRLNLIIQKSPLGQFEDYEKNNAMSEIANHLKTTQIGKNIMGVDKKFFRGDRRNIHDSQYGHIGPIVTPDREKCGAVTMLAAGSQEPINVLYKNILDYFEEDLKELDTEDVNGKNKEPEPEPEQEQKA